MHKLLIRAALDAGNRGRDSFEAWKKSVNLTDVDYPSQKMLSAIRHHLDDDDVSHQVLKAARFTWLRSQLLINAGLRAGDKLTTEGIPAVFIKGGAILARTRVEISRRPMDDVDLLIRLEHVPHAVKALNQAGFFSDADSELVECPELVTRNTHAIAFRTDDGAEVDLHWQALKGPRNEAAEKALWSRSTHAILLGRQVLALSPEDLLMQVISNNREGSDSYWVLDSLQIIRDNELSFVRLMRIAGERQMRRTVLIALAIISSFDSRAIPLRYRILSMAARLQDLVSSSILKARFFHKVVDFFAFRIPSSLEGDNSYIEAKAGNQCRCSPVPEDDGELLFFYGYGDQDRYCNPTAVINWHRAEETGAWSSAPVSHVCLPLSSDLKKFAISLTYRVISSRYSPDRQFAVFVDGKLVRKRFFRNPHGILQSETFDVSRSGQATSLILSFALDSTIVPRDHGMSLDPRQLGLFLHEIRISRWES